MRSIILLLFIALPFFAKAQQPSYTCFKTKKAPCINGKIKDRAWKKIAWTSPFVDIQDTSKVASQNTRAKLCWDDEYLYIAAHIEDHHIWSTMTKQDTTLYLEDVLEVFLDPDGDGQHYYEIEINPLETIFDLKMDKAYIHGGKADVHWTATGLKKGVYCKSSNNDARDLDQYWSVELAIPWVAFAEKKPQKGDRWRINFLRTDWKLDIQNGYYKKKGATTVDLWVWACQGSVNMHLPEKWGYVEFR